jgi:hypothetical protein
MSEAPPRAELARHVPAEARMAVGLMTDDEIRRSFRIAKAFAEVGTLKGAPSPEVAFAKMTVGRDLGLGPAQSIMSIDFVEGGIMIRGVRLLAWLREHPTYDYKIMHSDRESATVRILGFPADEQFEGAYRFRGKWWEVLGEETFTEQDAIDAGKLPQDSKKAAWNAWRKDMLRWRAASQAVKAHAPDIFNGIPVYTEADFDVDGSATEVVGEGVNAGAGAAQGLDLGPKVEAILKRAADLGHAGIADRATAEMTLMGQSPAWVEDWCTNAKRALDEMEAAQVTDAEVVEAEATPEDDAAAAAAVEEALAAEIEAEIEQRRTMEAETTALEDEAATADAEGRDADAEGLRERAQSIRDEIAARWPDEGEQTSLGGL